MHSVTTTRIIIIIVIIVIIIENCQAPTQQLKALNKHSITHIMYIEMENVIRKKEEEKTNIM